MKLLVRDCPRRRRILISSMSKSKRIRRRSRPGRGILISSWIIWSQEYRQYSFNSKDRIYNRSQTVRCLTPKCFREEILRFSPGITSTILTQKLTSPATKLNSIWKKASTDLKTAKIINRSRKTKLHPENKQSKSATKESRATKRSLPQFKIRNIPGSKCCQACQQTTQKIKKN